MAVGTLELRVTCEHRSGHPPAAPDAEIHFVLTSTDGTTTRKVSTDRAGRVNVSDLPVGRYSIGLTRFGNYPIRTRIRHHGDERTAAAQSIEVAVASRGTPYRIVVTESPMKRLRRMSLWLVFFAALSFLAWGDTSELIRDEQQPWDDAVLAICVMVLIYVVVVAVVVESRSKFHRIVRNPISRHPATSAADAMLIAVCVSLVAFFSTFATLELVGSGLVDALGRESTEPATVRDLFQSFHWHMADAIPVVDVPEAWNWENPVRISGGAAWLVGFSFLFARILVAVAIAGLFLEAWRHLFGAPDPERVSLTSERLD